MTGHLLALEHAARILTLAGRTVRAVGNRDTVRGTQTAEVPALHGTGKALTNARAANVDLLAADEVVGRQLCAHVDQVAFRHAEFHQLLARGNPSLGEVAAHRLRSVLGLGVAEAHLHGAVAIAFFGLLGNDLTAVHFQHGYRLMRAVFGEEAHHAHFLCDQSGAHGSFSVRSLLLSRALRPAA